MSDKVKCPKCKEQMFEDARYSIIRDEIICFSGRCLNCGFEITAESLYESLKNKFDLEKDIEVVEAPLEYALSKVQSTDEEIRKRILSALIKIYEQKGVQSNNEDEVQKYLYKKISCEQALNGRKYDDVDVLKEIGLFYCDRKRWLDKSAVYFEQAISLDQSNRGLHGALVSIYEDLGRFDEAIKHLDIEYTLDFENDIPSSEELREFQQNLYFIRKGRLLFEKDAYEDAITHLKKVYDIQGFPLFTDSGDPVTPKTVANELMLQAFVYLNNYEQAVKVYNEILSIDPNYEVDPDDRPYLFFSLMKALLEKDKNKAFEIVKEIDPEEWANYDSAAEAFQLYFLKGDVYLTCYLCGYQKNTEVLEEASKCFKAVYTVFEDFCWGTCVEDFFSNVSEWGGANWERLFGSINRILPEAHRNRGRVLEELGRTDEAFVEYKKAAEFDGYKNDKELVSKIDETKSKMFRIYEAKLKEKADELGKLLDLRPLGNSERDVAQRILMHLESVKDQFPEISQLKDMAQKLGFRVPRHLFKECRGVVEQYFNKVYDAETQKYPDLPKTKNLWSKIENLHGKDIINGYIRGLVSLIWAVGGKAGHRSDNLWVDALKIEDAEVVVVATIRFLSWYIETY